MIVFKNRQAGTTMTKIKIERNIAAKRIYTAPVILNKGDIKGSFIKHIDDKKMVFNQSSFNIIIFLAAVFTIYMYVVHMAFAPNIRANKEIKEIKIEVEERENRNNSTRTT